MTNEELASQFEKLADILEFQGENPFKVNAYRKASRVLKDLSQDIAILYKEGKLASLPGFGSALVKKAEEYLTTGKISKLEQLKKEVPEALIQLLDIQNLGPRTLAAAHKQLGVQNLQDLIQVIENGELAKLPGMGDKKVKKIKEGIDFFLSASERIRLDEATLLAEELMDFIKAQFPDARIAVAGSIRRMKETVHDIDLLVTSNEPEKIFERFLSFPRIDSVLAAGETKSSIMLDKKVQADLRHVPEKSFGAALQYFTGSQAHNIKIRTIAKKKNLKINEYGVFENEKFICGNTEEEVYQALGLQWIPPEMREDRGEVELAADNNLPKLIEMADLQGDLHVHSTDSDGHSGIFDLIEHAEKMGWKYLAICDHSRSAGYANGLSIERLLEQIERIKEIDAKLPDFKLLAGSEVDILDDGTLDYPDEILAKLDIVVASIHSNLGKDQTNRLLKAMDNPYVDIIAHPTGRLINKREAYAVDIFKIIEKARQKNIALELNSHPMRLDLNDIHLKVALEKGVSIAINTDAHHVRDFANIRFGIGTARRGWLSSKNVINTFSYEKLLKWKQNRFASAL